jgi:hypothetical protein
MTTLLSRPGASDAVTLPRWTRWFGVAGTPVSVSGGSPLLVVVGGLAATFVVPLEKEEQPCRP